MLATDVSPREVEVSYLLAESLRNGPFDFTGYRALVAAERIRLAQLSDQVLELSISDHRRRARYNGARWRLEIVGLDTCSVWPRMGERRWACGPVPNVAMKLAQRQEQHDRLWTMASHIRQPFTEMPIIVFRCGERANRLRIDDGCHRSVAYFVAGLRHAIAFVGEIDDRLNLKWRWEG